MKNQTLEPRLGIEPGSYAYHAHALPLSYLGAMAYLITTFQDLSNCYNNKWLKSISFFLF